MFKAADLKSLIIVLILTSKLPEINSLQFLNDKNISLLYLLNQFLTQSSSRSISTFPWFLHYCRSRSSQGNISAGLEGGHCRPSKPPCTQTQCRGRKSLVRAGCLGKITLRVWNVLSSMQGWRLKSGRSGNWQCWPVEGTIISTEHWLWLTGTVRGPCPLKDVTRLGD